MVAVASDSTSASEFGRRLRELREAKGWTQAELGERAGLMYQAISRLERGAALPAWDTVLKLADAIGISLDEFRVPPAEPEEPPRRGRPRKD